MTSNKTKFRLVTRSDFDGLVCAVLMKHLDLIEEIKFVHPKDMQDGVIDIGPNDVTTNLPFVDGVHLAFDHHLSETLRVGSHSNHIIDPKAASAARVVFDYYGGAAKFPAHWSEMMSAVDKADSAQYSLDEILNPSDWTLLNFVMDARTGLGRFRDFRVSNYQLMMDLIAYCGDHDINEIMALPDVVERTNLYMEHQDKFKEQLRRCSTVTKNLVVLDLRNEDLIHPGNRFMLYALYPDQNISIHVIWGLQRQNTVFAIGKSIVNRSSKTDIGPLCLLYGGGGHANAGTCQVSNESCERILTDLVTRITADG
jgi:nanoRNase/pAp phosphatase (c-di-AMP/oligoRNAs hydrolase)